MKKYIVVILVIIFTGNILKAQEVEDIFTDRPDVTESPLTMYKNFFQFESGIKFDKFQNDPATDYLAALPELLIRFGVIKNLEIRLGLVYLYEHINTSFREMYGNTSGDGTNSSFSGLQAPEFSFKFRFFEGKDFIPMTAVIFSTGIPALAGEKFKLKHFNPDIKLAFHNELSDKIELEYNIGLSWNTEDKTKTGFYTLSLNYAPFQVASIYIESFTYYQKELVPDYNLDFGFSFLLKKNMQADIYAGTQLREQPNILFGAGFSIRLPK